MMERLTFIRWWVLHLRKICASFLAAMLLLYIGTAMAQAVPPHVADILSVKDNTPLLSELPDEFASCFLDADSSLRVLLPFVRGGVWQEGLQADDTFLPVLLLGDTATLYFLEKDAQSNWHAAQMKDCPSYAVFSQRYGVELNAISDFSYYPQTTSPFDGKQVAGSILISFTVSTEETGYVISTYYETNSQTASGWIFERLSVLPISLTDSYSTSVESNCFPGTCFDAWNVVNTGKTFQYQYYLNDQCNLVFDVEMPYTEAELDLLIIDELSLLGAPQLYLSAEVNTTKNGNGKAVNLRAQPEGKRIAKIPNGTSIQIANRSDNWCLVKYDDLWGFVDARFLVGTDAYEQKKGGS